MSRSTRWAVAVFTATALASPASPAPATPAPTPVVPHAAPGAIVVNTADDVAPDAGVFPADGLCSFRAALQAAQDNGNSHDADCAAGSADGVDEVRFEPALADLSVVLTLAHDAATLEPLPTLDAAGGPVRVSGPSDDLFTGRVTIDAAQALRPFTVRGTTLTLDHVNVTNGSAGDPRGARVPSPGKGGVVYADGGATVELLDALVQFGTADRGGVVYAEDADVRLQGGAAVGNRAVQGGVAFLEGSARLRADGELFYLNGAEEVGGVVAAHPGADATGGPPVVGVRRSAVAYGVGGGAFHVASDRISSPTTLVEVADSSTRRSSPLLAATTHEARFVIRSATLGGESPAFTGFGGGEVRNTIFLGGTCVRSGDPAAYAGSHNLASGTGPDGCAAPGLGALGAPAGVDPEPDVGAFGGRPFWYSTDPGSNAVDAGDAAWCGPEDQRGFPRHVDVDGTPDSPAARDCDIGALEIAPTGTVSWDQDASSVGEGAGPVAVRARIDFDDPNYSLRAAVSVPIVVAAGTATAADLSPGAFWFPAEAGSGSVAEAVVTIVDDALPEGDEVAELELALTAPLRPGARPVHSLTVTDDEQPVPPLPGCTDTDPQTARHVCRVYLDLLGRAADPAGKAYWLARLDAGESRQLMARAFIGTPEYRTAVVRGLYLALLRRPADAVGLAAWADVLRRTGDPDPLRASLLASKEAYDRAGGTPAGFADAVYAGVLRRVPTGAERGAVVEALGTGGSRGAVAAELLRSSEADAVTVAAIYERFLRRSPPPAETTFWVGRLQAGSSELSLARQVIGSPEYFSRA